MLMQIVHTEFQDQLVRGLAHRMNNILTLFHGYLGLLLDNQKLDQPTLDGLAKIKQGATQASELMDRTHALVRPSTTVMRSIDLGEYLRMLRAGFEGFRGPRTEIELSIEDDLPHVQGDASRVKTAMVELVRNACEATFAGGGRVLCSVHSEKAKGGRSKTVVFTVTDNGPGIPEELLEKVFVPFFTTKKKQNAAGLGLTVAQSFVQQHKGTLKVTSSDGSTVVEMRLPAE
jgi:signal transduction histidine kinase